MKWRQTLCRVEAALPASLGFWLVAGLMIGLVMESLAIGVALGMGLYGARTSMSRRNTAPRHFAADTSDSSDTRGPLDLQTALSLGPPAACQLYHFAGCPYCLRVRWAMQRRGITVALRNIHSQGMFREELVAGGGKQQVPCLRIVTGDGAIHWLYESADIIRYLTAMLPGRK